MDHSALIIFFRRAPSFSVNATLIATFYVIFCNVDQLDTIYAIIIYAIIIKNIEGVHRNLTGRQAGEFSLREGVEPSAPILPLYRRVRGEKK